MATFNPEQSLINAKREFGEHGGVAPSISRSSTFTVMDPSTMPEIFRGIKGPERGGCFLYSRHFNPTVDVLSRYLAAMEGTEAAVCTSSGMSAISCTILQICKKGDHIIASDTIYGGTHALLEELLPEFGIQTTFTDITDLESVRKSVKKETKIIFTETVGNPTLKIADIPSLTKIGNDAEAMLVVDNTFSPMIISPAILGAHVVVSSMTKFINGASDLIAGTICCKMDFVCQLMDLHKGRVMLLGPTMDPRMAFDIIQRLPHLPLRMREHGKRALAIAQKLQELGLDVIYPGLDTHPQFELYQSMMNPGFGYGGMVSLNCGTREKAEEFMTILQRFPWVILIH